MKQIIIFTLDGTNYCLSVDEIFEIINYSQTSKVPESPEFVEGLINLRGSVFAIICLKKFFNPNPIKVSKQQNTTILKESKIIILNSTKDNLGIIVDEVKEILKINEDDIDVRKEKLVNHDNKHISGIIELNGEKIYQINLDSIFSKNKTVI
ncbi:MAG: chemotaxis protein CheW [Clostridiales bacterium]